MRTDSAILADLDRLRDNRGTISEDEYHLASERLWNELRKHDRKRHEAIEQERRKQAQALAVRRNNLPHHDRHKRQEEIEQERHKQEQALAERRNKRFAQAQRRLDRWLAQPTPTTAASLRAKLEEFLRIPTRNNPELRSRQARIKARLAPPTPTPAQVQRSNLTDEERLVRRAEKSGDKEKVLEIARRYHHCVKRLHRSQHAEIQYGPGGERQVTWPGRYRSGRANYPTVWKNAGAWIDYSACPPVVVLEDYRGQMACRLQLPLQLVTFEGLKDGDLWGIRHGSRVERWAMGEAIPVVVGYA